MPSAVCGRWEEYLYELPTRHTPESVQAAPESSLEGGVAQFLADLEYDMPS